MLVELEAQIAAVSTQLSEKIRRLRNYLVERDSLCKSNGLTATVKAVAFRRLDLNKNSAQR